ncbi:30S ribosomal protein S21, chloroplastic-like [Salvia miltiorrhiza]|uniref:30S ribosomal protein S21, chloroplastic-like n=1 Tax=Salvia miltiorrhiza TaxID=226208 RepID=UPI0025AC0BF3|nr:30S ribosomal protein S21, chloroplastic-like [Salvia miltiorrhiza]
MAVSKLNPLYLLPPHNPTSIPQPPNLPLLPFKDPSAPLSLKTRLNLCNLLRETPFKTTINQNEEQKEGPFNHYCEKADSLSVAFPALAFSNTLFFATNVALIVGEDDHEEKLISRFRREVLKAGVLQECRRRRFFECSQEKRKRKSREAARRNRKRRPRPQPKDQTKDKAETSKKKTQDTDGDDNWEYYDIDLPYS